MSTYIIDRRDTSRDKHLVNRKRFIDRYRKNIKESVEKTVSSRSVQDIKEGEDVIISSSDISEPIFTHGKGGDRHYVHPGNDRFSPGDTVDKPRSGSGRGQGGAGDSGEALDDFVFHLSYDEYLDVLFDGLELPNLEKRSLKSTETYEYQHAGFVTEGTPAKLSIIRTMIEAKTRKIGLYASTRKRLEKLEEEYENDSTNIKLKQEIDKLRFKLKRITFIDDTDLRYKFNKKVVIPSTNAVMFCLMDVSGSMTAEIKSIAKKFYILLYLFLTKQYSKIEIVFIKHHTDAKEVDEETFFTSRETGGTKVSSALLMAQNIIQQRYPSDKWNIYIAQASDGDNWPDDNKYCSKIISEILPLIQYFTYTEISPKEGSLWTLYKSFADTHTKVFAQKRIKTNKDVFTVFFDLFKKKKA